MVSIFIRTAIIYLLLTISMKIMGKRQIGELDVGELVSTLLISEIVSIAIDTPDIPLLNAVIPMFLIISLEIIISHIKNKSKRLKCIIEGVPSFIIYDGELDQDELLKNRISINEVLTEMRVAGITDISNVRFCILEAGGKLSFFEDEKGDIVLPIITDGEFEEENLKRLSISKDMAERNLGARRVCDVFLMTANKEKSFNIIYKEEKSEK